MTQAFLHILLTKKLPPSSMQLIKSFGWNVDVIETLDISLIDVKEIPSENFNAWIISSRNSLPVVEKFISKAPATIYCIGDWMKSKVGKITSSQVLSFENMAAMAVELKKQKFQSLLYFCGDHHRMELEEELLNSSSVIKVVTHESRMTFPVLSKMYDVVFVFSPRGAESLLKNNSFTNETLFASIGPTTDSFIKEKGITKTFVASYPDVEVLLNEVNNYLLSLTTGIPAFKVQ
jgi:uroporphyrinogen-III synthase